jgi:hypothetical protein
MDVDTALLRMRSVIADYRTALNQPDPRFRVSVLDAIRELARLTNTTDAVNEVSLNVETVIALTSTMDEVVSMILAAADLGQFQSAQIHSPWATAHFTDSEHAKAAFAAASRLDGVSLSTLDAMTTEILQPTPIGIGITFDDLKFRLDTLRRVSGTLDKFTPELFDRSIDDFVSAFAPKSRDSAMPGNQRRRLKKLAKEFQRPGAHVPDMFDALSAARDARQGWNSRRAAGWGRSPSRRGGSARRRPSPARRESLRRASARGAHSSARCRRRRCGLESPPGSARGAG